MRRKMEINWKWSENLFAKNNSFAFNLFFAVDSLLLIGLLLSIFDILIFIFLGCILESCESSLIIM